MSMNFGLVGGLSSSGGGEPTIPDARIAYSLASANELRSTIPNKEGEIAFIESYNKGDKTRSGGGFFVGHIGTATDDGGYTFAGKGFYWKRHISVDDLNVTHFGAVPDGKTDAGPAAELLLTFLSDVKAAAIVNFNSVKQARIVFPEGQFYITPRDWTKKGEKIADGSDDLLYYPSGYYAHGGISIIGKDVPYGKQPLTRIISDKGTAAVFALNHRRVTLSGIEFDGQQVTEVDTTTQMLKGATLNVWNDTASNKQAFCTNECVAGTFMFASKMRFLRTGGSCMSLQDSLDTVFEYIYSEENAAPVIEVGFSRYPTGAWNQPTSIEIRNCNFLTNRAPAVRAPRAQQSLMRNVWFSGPGTTPMDIPFSQWTMDTVCVEGAVQNPVAYKGQLTMERFSVPTGNAFNFNTAFTDSAWAGYKTFVNGSALTEWLSDYEQGQVRTENHGIEINGSLKSKWHSGVIRGRNNAGSVSYLRIGKMTLPTVGGIWEFEVISRSGYSSVAADSSPKPATADTIPGKTIIRVHRTSSATQVVTYHHEGTPAVLDVLYISGQYGDSMESLYVKLNGYTGEFVVNAKCTGPTRYDSGTCALFYPDGTQSTTAPTGTTAAIARFSMHNGKAGIGAYGTEVSISSTIGSPADVSAPKGYVKVYLNGVAAYIPYFQ